MSKHRKSPKAASRQDRRAERRKNKISPTLEQNADREGPDRERVKPRTEPVIPLTESQEIYDEAFRDNKVVFGVGPAGTGKTWFAAMRAARALDNGEIDRIIVTRPVVEAEESMGFLPGDLQEKYEPYLRPVKEALEEYFGSGKLEYLLRKGLIEPRPMAFLRGATLKNCWVIADEMQNATDNQFKLLLTRFGQNAKFIINGDPTQTDLPIGKSGLLRTIKRLDNLDDIETVEFERQDIVREGLVQEIVEAFEGN